MIGRVTNDVARGTGGCGGGWIGHVGVDQEGRLGRWRGGAFVGGNIGGEEGTIGVMWILGDLRCGRKVISAGLLGGDQGKWKGGLT